MTVENMLKSMSSRELSEWYIMQNLDFWKERLIEKDANRNPSKALMNSVMGSGIAWQQTKS